MGFQEEEEVGSAGGRLGYGGAGITLYRPMIHMGGAAWDRGAIGGGMMSTRATAEILREVMDLMVEGQMKEAYQVLEHETENLMLMEANDRSRRQKKWAVSPGEREKVSTRKVGKKDSGSLGSMASGPTGGVTGRVGRGSPRVSRSTRAGMSGGGAGRIEGSILKMGRKEEEADRGSKGRAKP